MQTTHDIIIVGGGMVGLTLACMLAEQTTLSIAVLEEKISAPAPHRVSAISFASQKIFSSINVWEAIQHQGASPFRKMMVWDAAGKGEIHFDSSDVAQPLLGHIIENDVIQTALKNQLMQYPSVEMLVPVKPVNLIQHNDAIELVTDEGRVLKARLAIAADGANSWLRKQVGIDVERFDYQQHAIVATVQTVLPHHETARQVFLSTGPLAFLPLMEKQTSSIVWSLPNDEAARLMNVEINDFQHELTQAFDSRLGEVVSVGQRFMFPLSRQKASTYIGQRIALVGDAAHAIHPLAGQGVNMGLQDVASLMEIILKDIQSQKNIASLSSLRAYERWRKADNLMMFKGVDGIQALFASDKNLTQNIRSLGLNTVNNIQWIKNIFTRHAMGIKF
jgi:2-octaprenylphenol hydroxylase